MEKKRQRKRLAALNEDDEQQQQQEEAQQQDEQQAEPQQQKKRQKDNKKIRQQEARRLKDATLAERQITALQQSLNPQLNGRDDEKESAELQAVIPPEQQDTDDEQQEARIRSKPERKGQQKTQSFAAFSSTIASLLADEGAAGSAAVLSKDTKVFENIKSIQAEEKLRREIIAERRHKRGLAHRQPTEDDPEVEATLKKLATKGSA